MNGVTSGMMPDAPVLLDLFCGQGGAGLGYARAGFRVVGVDIKPQSRYPFEFHQADALTFPLDGFDAIHASPPCQKFSVSYESTLSTHDDLVTPMLERLADFPGPWVVENVVGAPLPDPHLLCGSAFMCVSFDDDGTPLVMPRHRLVASNVPLKVPACSCARMKRLGWKVAGIYGGGRDDRLNRFGSRGGYSPLGHVRRRLMGCDHMSLRGLSQAIPPIYTAHIGTQLYAPAMRRLGVN